MLAAVWFGAASVGQPARPRAAPPDLKMYVCAFLA